MSYLNLQRIRSQIAEGEPHRGQKQWPSIYFGTAFHGSTYRRWMWIASFALAANFMGSTILTPLYPIFQQRFGFPELTVTLIYAVYVIGNLAVLFFFGRLSDQIGRRLTTLAALGITLLATLGFLFALDTAWLFAARIVNGLGAGLGATALTAWIAELEPQKNRGRAAVVASTANLGGLTFGALMTGLLAQYAPWPLHLSYVVFLVLLAGLIALLWGAPETVEHPERRIRKLDLRPRVGVPPGIRIAFVAPAALSFTGFALAGFYAALGPGLLMHSLHQHNLFIVGSIVATFFGVSAVTAILTRGLGARPAMIVTLALLLIGLGLLTVAEATHSLTWLLIGTVATGAVLALAYRASLQIINEISPEGQRAEVLASFQIVHFIANSLPVIGVGLLALVISTPVADRVFAVVLMMLAALACAIGLRYIRRDAVSNSTSH
jgi:MFS family permease